MCAGRWKGVCQLVLQGVVASILLSVLESRVSLSMMQHP